MNVFMISVLMIISTTSIYMVTRGRVYDEIEDDFRRISYTWDSVRENIELNDAVFDIETFNEYLGNSENYDFLESRLGNAYYLSTNTDRVLDKSIGFYDIDHRIFSEILYEIKWNSEEIQFLSFDDIHWAYRIKEYSDGYVIKLMNITKRRGVLTNLIFTGLIIIMITIILIIFLSIYLTNKSVKPLDEAYKRQKQFVSDASHELRTPLASINANVDLILAKSYIRPAEKKWLEYIKTETLRMSNLTKELLFLAELDEQTKEDMDITDVDLSYIAETYVLGMEAMAYEEKLTLLKDIDEDVRIKGNKEKLSQLIVILLENALNYTPSGGTVTLSLKKQRNHVALDISNTGSFIPEDQIKKVFDRFYRIDKSRGGKAESHGLGLAIAKSIVERHGGIISCTSERDGLTNFTIKFINN